MDYRPPAEAGLRVLPGGAAAAFSHPAPARSAGAQPAPSQAAAAPAVPAAPLDGPPPVRAFVLGADALARAGLCSMLDRMADTVVVGEGEIGPRGQACLQTSCPDVIVLHDAALLPQARLLADQAGSRPELLAVGGVPDARAERHAHLPSTVSPPELAAAVRMVSAGYRLSPPDRADTPAPAPVADRPRVTAPVDPGVLTERERDILRHVTAGQSNAEIARALTLSEFTVKSHVRSLLQKLALPNRVHAVIYAFENDLR